MLILVVDIDYPARTAL